MATPEKNEPPGHQTPALHAPWRQEYIESLGDSPDRPVKGAPKARPASFLHDFWLRPERDEDHHVVVRTDRGMILLNRFPYSGGHLLVALGEAHPGLLDYDEPQRTALWRLTDLAAELMQLAVNPQGINIGINQGRAAGAGVPGHLHVHLVPRWSGDVNFLDVVGNVRVINSALSVMYRRYRDAYAAIASRAKA